MPLFDLNGDDEHLSIINIKNPPLLDNHVGAFVYYASLITAIGRSQITLIANKLKNNA